MSTNSRQSQFELFPGDSKYNQDSKQPQRSPAKITLSLDKALIVCVTVVMIMVLSFSMGVEQGKRNVKRSVLIHEAQAATSNLTPDIELQEDRHVEERPSPVIPVFENEVPATDSAQVSENEAEDLSGVYTVQVASFKKEKYAQEEASTLKKKGYESIVLPKGDHSIVCVGKFVKRQEAKILSGKLKKRYRDCLVRRL